MNENISPFGEYILSDAQEIIVNAEDEFAQLHGQAIVRAKGIKQGVWLATEIFVDRTRQGDPTAEDWWDRADTTESIAVTVGGIVRPSSNGKTQVSDITARSPYKGGKFSLEQDEIKRAIGHILRDHFAVHGGSFYDAQEADLSFSL